jgi:L-rhamnose mutarotase
MNSKENQANKEISYPVEKMDMATKRVCLTLDLKNDPELIQEYLYYHSKEGHWPEIADGIRQAGIAVMDIYRLDNRLFMICEVPLEKDFDAIWTSMGSYSKQPEWAGLMAKFQQAVPGHKPGWIKMEQIYTLPKKDHTK